MSWVSLGLGWQEVLEMDNPATCIHKLVFSLYWIGVYQTGSPEDLQICGIHTEMPSQCFWYWFCKYNRSNSLQKIVTLEALTSAQTSAQVFLQIQFVWCQHLIKEQHWNLPGVSDSQIGFLAPVWVFFNVIMLCY